MHKPLRSAVMFALAAPTIVLAQQAAPGLEEIIVTAQKRTESLQDIPFSVAAVTEESIRRTGSTNLAELARNVSGLAITDLGPGQSQVAIRGISAGQVVRDQAGVKESVGIYLDESAISVALFTPDLDLYDVERFEVLRGPQGTLFGAGSSSGTLRYITRQPQLDEFTVTTELTAATVDDGEFGGGVKGALNVPLGDTAAGRIVAYYSQLPGFIDSVYPGRGTKEDVNSGERTGVRASLRFEPNEDLSITPRVVYQKLETDGFPRIDVWNILGNPYTTTEPAVSVGERRQVTQLREGIDDDFTLVDLTIDYDFGAVTLTSVSAYTDRQVVVTRDASQLTGSVTYDLQNAYGSGDISADVRLNSPLIDSTDLEGFSQELRLSSNDVDAPFRWLVGAFYQQVDRQYGQALPTPGYDARVIGPLGPPLTGLDSTDFGAPPDNPYFSDLTYDFEQFALFGEATYHFTDAWSLTAGLRYYDFSEDRVLTFAGLFADQGYTDEPGSTSSDGYSPRAILAYRPNDDLLFTAQVARGFRLGGINDPLNVTLCTAADLAVYDGNPTWDDEETTNYELGAKTRWADGTVQLNGAVFLTRNRWPAGHRRRGLLLLAHHPECRRRIRRRRNRTGRPADRELGLRRVGHLRRCDDHEVAARRDGPADRGYPRGQPAADRARTAGRGERDVFVAVERFVERVRQLHGAVRRLVVHATRRPGSGLRRAVDDADRQRRHDSRLRRPVDHRVPLRCGVARVRDRQPAHRRAERALGARCVRQQRLGRTRVPVDRSRARPQRACRLPDQPAAHVRCHAEPRLLIRVSRDARASCRRAGPRAGRRWPRAGRGCDPTRRSSSPCARLRARR